jgi:hypothetical protein
MHFAAIEATGYCTLEEGNRVSFVVKTVSEGTSRPNKPPWRRAERSTVSQLHGDKASFQPVLKQATTRRLKGRGLANSQLQPATATKPKTGNKG